MRLSTAPIASTKSKIETDVLPGVRVFGRGFARRGEDIAAEQRALGQFFGRFAIALIFEQALDQVALEFLGLLGVGKLRMRQHARTI